MGQKAEAQSFLTVTNSQGEALYKVMLTYSPSEMDGVALFSDEEGLIRIEDSSYDPDTLVEL